MAPLIGAHLATRNKGIQGIQRCKTNSNFLSRFAQRPARVLAAIPLDLREAALQDTGAGLRDVSIENPNVFDSTSVKGK